MTTKSTDLVIQPTLADAFEIGQREGLKEAFTEINSLITQGVSGKELQIYVNARLKSIQDFSLNNPFKQKDGK